MEKQAMVTCPVCKHENQYGALICAQCYALLVASDAEAGTITLKSETIAALLDKTAVPLPSRLPDKLATNEVALYVNGNKDPMIFQLGRQVVLGRASSPNAGAQIDLTPFGAFNKGVSRLHAIIRRDGEGGLEVEDQGSSNGTWVNGSKLLPYAPQKLHSRDLLQLSQLELVIVFGGSGTLRRE